MLEEKLPSFVLSKASLSGNEYAWPLSDVNQVISAAETAGLAIIGGQPQFRFSDGTCELYWLNADSTARLQHESWQAYVRRTADEVRTAFRNIVAETDFVAEAHRFAFLIEKVEQGEDLMSHLYFVLYFDDESTIRTPSGHRIESAPGDKEAR